MLRRIFGIATRCVSKKTSSLSLMSRRKLHSSFIHIQSVQDKITSISSSSSFASLRQSIQSSGSSSSTSSSYHKPSAFDEKVFELLVKDAERCNFSFVTDEKMREGLQEIYRRLGINCDIYDNDTYLNNCRNTLQESRIDIPHEVCEAFKFITEKGTREWVRHWIQKEKA